MPTPTPLDVSFSRWPWWRRWFGRRSERSAAQFLRKIGYRIVAANVEDATGEIDLIAIDGRTIVIVEVRSTSSDDLLRTIESVDLRKQRKLTQAAIRYLTRRRVLDQAFRFDIIAISWPANARVPVIRHIPNAFEAVGRHQMFS